MPGNKIGGRKAAIANKARHGEDFYKRIGAIGGKKSTSGGFAADRERASWAGRKGGMISRRKRKALVEKENIQTEGQGQGVESV